jgi:RNA polymerase sigma factor (sigma-70 family)
VALAALRHWKRAGEKGDRPCGVTKGTAVFIADFEGFVRSETPALVAFVRRVANVGTEQAKDAVQEAVIKAYLQWSEIENPRAWVRRVAQRAAAHEARRTEVGIRRAVVGGHHVDVHHDPDVANEVVEHEQLLRYLADLPRKQRDVMAWYLDDFSVAEIAGQLDMEPATVRSNLRHARNALRDHIRRDSR